MRSMLALVSLSFLGLVAAGCQDGTRHNSARLSLATVCAVETPIDSAKVGFESVALDKVAIDPIPVDDPPPPPPPETVPVACCLLSDGTPAPAGSCDPMDYPPETCDVLPDADDATIITEYTEETYDGEAIPTAIFGCQPDDECEEGEEGCEPEDECEEDTYSLNVNGAVAAVAFDSPTQIRVYSLGSAVQVRTENADALHAVVPMGHTFFDPNHLVYQGGVLIGSINAQTDCFPTRCGFTCSIC